MEAILQADLGSPIDEWLKAQHDLSASARRQVASILLFLQLLDRSRRLIPDARAWRCDYQELSEALRQRARHAYASAGCDSSQAELIGNPALTREALGRVLEEEPPFQRLENPDTRRNAVRFACHVHEAIARGKLIPQHYAQEQDSLRTNDPATAAAEDRRPHAAQPSPVFEDRGTIFNPEQYRVDRLRDDLWVYATVQFESPKGFAWLSEPDAGKQAQWKERLAAALLQDVDSLKRRAT